MAGAFSQSEPTIALSLSPSILKPQPVRTPESIQRHAYLRNRASEASSISSDEAVCRSSRLLERAAAMGGIP